MLRNGHGISSRSGYPLWMLTFYLWSLHRFDIAAGWSISTISCGALTKMSSRVLPRSVECKDGRRLQIRASENPVQEVKLATYWSQRGAWEVTWKLRSEGTL
ncbi:hypothetical protein DL96DRAFT_1614876 [Flagelloscypha sp. PMI_526]|nr:hypothetical protein DL96DRAFT_1614876 [Flagelloscypha sp. PMI_526]